MSLVTVFTSFSSAEAQLIRSRLDVSGFHAVVMHELSALSIDGYSMAAGGIRVEVPESEADEAAAFLATAVNLPEPGSADLPGGSE